MNGQDSRETADGIPEHLRIFPGLYVREGDRLIEASADDTAVARNYPWWPDKGPIADGRRLTIMTKQSTYQIGEPIRVAHVLEVVEPGQYAYVMGPKPVYGEYLDDRLATAPLPDGVDPFVPQIYDGEVLPGPAVDYNYEITTYALSETRTHRIYWQLGSLRSNVLTLTVTEAPAPRSQRKSRH